MAKEKKIKSKRPKAEPPKGFRDYLVMKLITEI